MNTKKILIYSGVASLMVASWVSLAQPVLAANVFAEEEATIKTIKTISPSTVSIAVYQELGSINLGTGETTKKKVEIGQGTGFIVSADGLIMTNRHVADKPGEFKVFLANGQTYTAEVAAIDKIDDLALLKISGKALPAATLGDSSKIQVGQTVIAVGNALGRYQNSATKGIVSGLGRFLDAGDATGFSERLEDVIQTDAAINIGNSGGPLVNLRGQVIGMNVAIESGAQSIGFAIPINEAKRIVESYKKYGKIRRAFLGVRYQMIEAGLKEEYGLTQDDGAFVLADSKSPDPAVVIGSPASQIGILEGDVITAINNIKITKTTSLRRAIMNFWPGEQVNLTFSRNGQTIVTKVTLTDYPQ
ncbi:MAG: trypsin-like peptidase domain-containing protein [Candidatus Komeilibacteria bacterium]|nr:trypsin-like peptidase domain-containing protein [Candidatus Komeilibacteria bacterium]